MNGSAPAAASGRGDPAAASGLGEPIVARAVLGGFFERLPALDPLVRQLVGDDPVVLKVELREPALRIAVDLGAHPLAIRFDTAEAGTVALAATAADFNAVLGGALTMGAAITRKRVVVRGSAARLMRVMPLFFVAPHLYAQHLAALGRDDLAPPALAPSTAAAPEEPMNALVSRLAYAAGFALGLLKTRLVRDLDVLGALEALGRGLQRARGAPPRSGPGPAT